MESVMELYTDLAGGSVAKNSWCSIRALPSGRRLRSRVILSLSKGNPAGAGSPLGSDGREKELWPSTAGGGNFAQIVERMLDL
jgi:hypothetical protein